MRRDILDRHSKVAYALKLAPLKRPSRPVNASVVGWDTEFSLKPRSTGRGQFRSYLIANTLAGSKEHRLDLWDDEAAKYGHGEPKIDWDYLYRAAATCAGVNYQVRDENGKRPLVILAVFYSQAEIQWLPIDNWNVQPLQLRPGGGHYRYENADGARLLIFDLSIYHPKRTLRDVAASYGLVKLDYNVANLNPSAVKDPDFHAYCIRDAQITRDIAHRMADRIASDWNLNLWDSPSPASLSSRVYRAHYLRETLDQAHPRHRRLALRAYIGGNVQAFVRGRFNGPHTELDIESDYAHSALELKVLPRRGDIRELATIDEVTDPQIIGGIVHCHYSYPQDADRPSLPVQAEDGIYYPLTGESYTTIEEVRVALAQGADIELIAAWGYSDGDTTLQDYLGDLVSRKRAAETAGDHTGRALYKNLANNLIGKLAQRTYALDPKLVAAYGIRWGYTPSECYSIENLEWVIEDWLLINRGIDVKVADYQHGACYRPEWAAIITGYARAVAAEAYNRYPTLIGNVDAVLVPGRVEEPLTVRRMTFQPRAHGDQVVVYRERLWALRAGELVTGLARHGINTDRRSWEEVLPWDPTALDIGYAGRRVASYREALSKNMPLGAEREYQARANLRWGWRRRLVDVHGELVRDSREYGQGPWTTVPWRTVNEVRTFRAGRLAA